jgi:hypothetical protein
MSSKPHVFRARLQRIDMGVPFYALDVPAKVSRAIDRKGTIPIVATINGKKGVRATITPRGGGLHRMFLNGTVRKRVGLSAGDMVDVAMIVDESPPVLATPPDVIDAMREADVLGAWERLMTRAKKNHILEWIEKAARETTRAKRVAKAVEVALRARERKIDRAT